MLVTSSAHSHRRTSVPSGQLGVAVALVVGVCGGTGACAGSSHDDSAMSGSNIVRLLTDGQAVFGIFSGEHTAEQGAVMAQNSATDFVFYSLERGPFDIPQMQAYKQALEDGAAEHAGHPLALRIPPIRDGADSARSRVMQALAAGVQAIVFPHVENADHAAAAVSSMGPDLWPGNPRGSLVNMLIVEDRVGVENVGEIVATPGVSVVFAGPGDLRRAYDGDMEAVENAIQTVLGACKEFAVPCGITAGVDDIEMRLAQGFRVIIVSEADALIVGRDAVGRMDHREVR